MYDEADVFFLSSVRAEDGAEEGQGVILLEAQASILVISTIIGEIPETVVDKKAAFLVQQKDADALADKLGYLIRHGDIACMMGQSGRAHVESNYSFDKPNDRMFEIYKAITIKGDC